MSTVRAKTDKNKENVLKIWCIFRPEQSPSCANSFQLAASWSASSDTWERLQLWLRDVTLGLSVVSLVWLESSPEKRRKTTRTPRLPRAITFPSELRFMQTLYRWKVDSSRFPTVPRMTHFKYQKAPKICLENWVKKLYIHANRWGFAGGATWWIRSPRGRHTCHAASPCATHGHPTRGSSINPTPLSHSSKFGSSLYSDLRLFWTETWEMGPLFGFRLGFKLELRDPT